MPLLSRGISDRDVVRTTEGVVEADAGEPPVVSRARGDPTRVATRPAARSTHGSETKLRGSETKESYGWDYVWQRSSSGLRRPSLGHACHPFRPPLRRLERGVRPP